MTADLRRRIPPGQDLLVFPLRMDADCTNGGVTSPARGITCFHLVEDPGEAGRLIAKNVPREQILVVRRRYIAGRSQVYATPFDPPGEGMVGYMAGGNYVHTSDGRYWEWVTEGGPISVHDRQETPDLYEQLSR